MAKKIIRKTTRKADEHRVFINGKEQTIKTSCKTFGKLYDESSQYGFNKDTFDLIGKCKTCAKQRGDICEACMVKTDQSGKAILDWEKTEKAPRKKSTKKVEKPFSLVIAQIQAGVPRKQIEEDLTENGFKGTAKSFVGTIGSVVNALNGKSRKPDGTIATYCKWLQGGKKGEEPKGDQGSQWYCKKVWEAIEKME